MPPNDSSTQVMNPLVGPSLSSRTSMHCLSSAGEPSMKKIRLAGSFHSNDGMVKTRSTASLLSSEGSGLVKSSSIAAIGKDTVLLSEAAAAASAGSKPSSSSNPGKAAGEYAASVAAKPSANATKAASSKPPPTDSSDPPEENFYNKASDVPKKPTTFVHLKAKYHSELTYMLLEFEKLERQLLGARKTEESAGSRERREKLHSFILHLQDTIQQIEAGEKEEVAAGGAADSGGTDTSSEVAETVQKLEEHILANLLPVKVRLKKQLAAQQGARHNPVGMPHNSQWKQRTDGGAKGTFAAAAEKRRKEAEEAYIEPKEPARPVDPDQTQYGKPIQKGGSSLTKKLHGQTLGNNKGESGNGIDDKTEKGEAKRYYGGMALGSDQIESSVTAASSVHKLMVRDTEKIVQRNRASAAQENAAAVCAPEDPPSTLQSSATPAQGSSDAAAKLAIAEPKLDPEELERRQKRRRRRRKRAQREQELKGSQPAEMEAPKAKKARQVKKQRGPRQVEYICALCNETYNSTCEYNPWWALAQHECPKCHKTQVPKVDISATANAIEYHPALLAHADDGSAAVSQPPPPPPPPPEVETVASAPTAEKTADDAVSLGSDVSSGLEDVSSDEEDSFDMDSDIDSIAMTPADRAENENFGAQYEGPKLEDDDAARLLVLMVHASTCAGQHRTQKQRDVCKSTRWMMLHVRDCPGTTSSFDICPFPWCRKVKHLLYHLVSCSNQDTCSICCNPVLSSNMLQLKGLNDHRLNACKDQLCKRLPLPRVAAHNRSTSSTKGTHPGAPPATKGTHPGAPSAEAKSTKPAPKIEQRKAANGSRATDPKAQSTTTPNVQQTKTVAAQPAAKPVAQTIGTTGTKPAVPKPVPTPGAQTIAATSATPKVAAPHPVAATAAKPASQNVASESGAKVVSTPNPAVRVKVDSAEAAQQPAAKPTQPQQTAKTAVPSSASQAVQQSTSKPAETRQVTGQQVKAVPVQTNAGAATSTKTAARAAATAPAVAAPAGASAKTTQSVAAPSMSTSQAPAAATSSVANAGAKTVPSQQRVAVTKSAPRTVQLVVTAVSGHATSKHMQAVPIVPAGAKLDPAPAPVAHQPSSSVKQAGSSVPAAAKPVVKTDTDQNQTGKAATAKANHKQTQVQANPAASKLSNASVAKPANTGLPKPIAATKPAATKPATPATVVNHVVAVAQPSQPQALSKANPATSSQPVVQLKVAATQPSSKSTAQAQNQPLVLVLANQNGVTQQQQLHIQKVEQVQQGTPATVSAKLSTAKVVKSQPSPQPKTTTNNHTKKTVKSEEPAPLLASVQAIVKSKPNTQSNATTHQGAQKNPASATVSVDSQNTATSESGEPSKSTKPTA